VRVAVAGSVATDHLMSFPGRFAETLLPGSLDHLSVSFLVDDLVIRRGGVAANICYGMGELGCRPRLVAAVGGDFAEYRTFLESHGVDTAGVAVHPQAHSARFVCTTDRDGNQIASFYPGAMRLAAELSLAGPIAGWGPQDLVVVSPDDPQAMLRHTSECRAMGVPFAADPSQQLTNLDGAQIEALIDGAAYLFTNAYESDLLAEKTGWSPAKLLTRVGVRVTTLGADGVVVETRDGELARVGAASLRTKAEPTGVGDAFRAGYLAALGWGLDHVAAAQTGCELAALVLETVGTQEYAVHAADLLDRLAADYGDPAAAGVRGHL
jgi:adenosine kinase